MDTNRWCGIKNLSPSYNDTIGCDLNIIQSLGMLNDLSRMSDILLCANYFKLSPFSGNKNLLDFFYCHLRGNLLFYRNYFIYQSIWVAISGVNFLNHSAFWPSCVLRVHSLLFWLSLYPSTNIRSNNNGSKYICLVVIRGTPSIHLSYSFCLTNPNS